MKKAHVSRFPFEEMYEYIGTSDTQILHLYAGITHPDPSYCITRQHSNCYSIEYVCKGKGVIQENNRIYQVSAGDFFILHPHTYHHYYADPQDPWEKLFFTVNKRTAFVSTLLQLYRLDDVVCFEQLRTPLQLEAILELFRSEQTDINDRLEDLILQTVTGLARQPRSESRKDSPVVRAKACIDGSITERICLQDVAREVCLDPSYLSRAFKKAYGLSPQQYIHRQKMALADSLLANTALSVEEIAARLSFCDVSHFSVAFTRCHGMTPTQYRNR